MCAAYLRHNQDWNELWHMNLVMYTVNPQTNTNCRFLNPTAMMGLVYKIDKETRSQVSCVLPSHISKNKKIKKTTKISYMLASSDASKASYSWLCMK
jgi:vancomycin permeability regulator SanA